jgi:hypothetical protein
MNKKSFKMAFTEKNPEKYQKLKAMLLNLETKCLHWVFEADLRIKEKNLHTQST